MSVKATDRAWESDASGNDLLVLLALADHAGGQDDPYDYAYPSVARLEGMTRLSRRTVQRCLRSLEDGGYIARTGEHTWGRGKVTTQYRIAGGRQSDAASSEDGGGVTTDAGGASPVTPNPSLGTVQGTAGEERAQARADEDRLFDFWREECNHPQAKFTPERRAKVRARLREGYTARQIAEGIRGAARAAYVDPETGKRYDDLELICRNGGKLEDFVGRAGLPTRTNVTPMRSRRGGVTAEGLMAAGRALDEQRAARP